MKTNLVIKYKFKIILGDLNASNKVLVFLGSTSRFIFVNSASITEIMVLNSGVVAAPASSGSYVVRTQYKCLDDCDSDM